MLILQNVGYVHPNKDLLFSNIHLSINRHQKFALTSNNGSGKSTLLKIIAGELPLSEGTVIADTKPYYIPQIFGQYNHLSIAQALRVEDKLEALHEILGGDVTDKNLQLLDDDWAIEERCNEALAYWELNELDLHQKMETLSGGQKTKVFLAGISIHQSQLVLLDEPSNHLDLHSRQLLYDFIRSTSVTLLLVSHDRILLNLLDTICELGRNGIAVYGGNYDFYAAQKQLENNALIQGIDEKEKALRKAKETERETLERQKKLDARGKKKQEKAGLAKIMMNTLRNSAENSTAKAKNTHAQKIGSISSELQELRESLPGMDKMKFGFDHSNLHNGKILFTATDINVEFHEQKLWAKNLNIQITSGERIALKGKNGSGKTTLIKLILGNLDPTRGNIYRAENKSVYIDQDYALINNKLSVYEQALQFNNLSLQEHEIKIRLTRFLFTREDWDKPCSALSGGEKMRLALCCLTINNTAPDMIILDEPTNNLDIQNIAILTSAINEYRGTLLVVSHDEYFLKQVNAQRSINL